MLISKHHIANQLNNGGRIYPRNGRNNMQIRTGNRLNNGEPIQRDKCKLRFTHAGCKSYTA
eukprot:scaffold1085_cov75-Skeletonema_marinoi.AAC.1